MMPSAPARGSVRQKSRPVLAGEICLGRTSLFDIVQLKWCKDASVPPTPLADRSHCG
jgi:hypothetical protein